MQKKLDHAFILKLTNEPLFVSNHFRLLNRAYQEAGISIYINKEGIRIPIYTPQLASILTTMSIVARNKKDQKEEQFNGELFMNQYIEGFFEGIEFFKMEHKVSTDTLYGLHAKPYVRGLHDQYFHIGKNQSTGWNHVMKSYPLVIANQAIKEYGFYSSLVTQVDELKSKHGKLFVEYAFDYCNKNGKKTNTEGEPKPKLELVVFFEKISDYNYIMGLLVEKGYCQANTYIWKDETGGKMKLLVTIIKYLHKQGYYKDNICPTNREILEICQNTFGLKIGPDSIKKTKIKSDEKYIMLKFIPLAPTIS